MRYMYPFTALTPLPLFLVHQHFPLGRHGHPRAGNRAEGTNADTSFQNPASLLVTAVLRRDRGDGREFRMFPQRAFHTTLSSSCPLKGVLRITVSQISCTMPTKLGSTTAHWLLCCVLPWWSSDSGLDFSPYNAGGTFFNGPATDLFEK